MLSLCLLGSKVLRWVYYNSKPQKQTYIVMLFVYVWHHDVWRVQSPCAARALCNLDRKIGVFVQIFYYYILIMWFFFYLFVCLLWSAIKGMFVGFNKKINKNVPFFFMMFFKTLLLFLWFVHQGQTDRQTDHQEGRQADRQTAKQTDSKAGRQTHRQTD